MKTILFLITLLAVATNSGAATRYLNAAATGANNGTSEADAWTSSWTAFNTIVAGDTLIVSPGTYSAMAPTNKANLTIQIKAGSTTQAVFTYAHFYNCDNIIVDGYEGGLQLFKFTERDTTSQHAINLRASIPATLQGLEVDRTATYLTTDTQQQHALRIWDYCGNVTIENCYFHHTSGDGINISQVSTPTAGREYDWIKIQNNTLTHFGDDGIQAGTSWVKVTGNTIDNGGVEPMFGGHPDGFQLNPDMRYATIVGNTIKGFNQNIFIEYARGEIYIYNNVVIGTKTDSADRALNYSTRSGASWSGKWVFANNTIYNFLCYQAMNGGLGVPVENRYIGNNIFVNCKTINAFEAATMDATNFYYDLPGVQYYTTDGAATGVPADRLAGSCTNANPLLSDPANGDFTLQAGSPAIGTGTNFSPIFSTDYAGTERSVPFDSGAFEFAAGTNAAPVVTITSPADGSTSTTATVTFTGTATDAEDGTISAGINWTSSIDGALGTGASITPTLSNGTHTITASRTDSGSLTATDTIIVTVTLPSATFNVDTLSIGTIRVAP